MKTRNIILGMLLFAFSACTPENKSVTEPLTPEETEEIDKKYPGFSYNYETYIYPKVNKLSKSSSFYLKLKKLTYADFMDFIQKQLQLHESKWEKQAEEKAIQEWNKKFDIEKLTHRLDAMTDSIITSWENYYKENNLNTYLSPAPLWCCPSDSQDTMYHLSLHKDFHQNCCNIQIYQDPLSSDNIRLR